MLGGSPAERTVEGCDAGVNGGTRLSPVDGVRCEKCEQVSSTSIRLNINHGALSKSGQRDGECVSDREMVKAPEKRNV